jgi:outer membrane biosynthesis protein TonB
MRVPTPRPTTDAIEIAASIRGRAPTPVPARQSQVLPPMGRDTPWPGDIKTPWPGMDAVSLGQVPHRTPKLLYGLVALGVCVGAVGLYIGLRRTDPPPQHVQVAPAPAPAPAAAIAPPAAPQKVEVIITSDAPNARVTFRRRLASTPFTITVNPTDIVELVEVSAPGKKTVRYWLTIDRPTTLHARLPKGSGMFEATEEQTLVALGEAALAAPVTDPAAAPAVAAVTPEPAKPAEPAKAEPAKPDDRKADEPKPVAVAARDDRRGKGRDAAQAKPTPRRIGKAAADEAAKAPEETAAVAAAEPPKPAVAPEPAIAKPVAPAEETRPKPVDPGVLDKSTINRVAGRYRSEVRTCYEQAKKSNPKLKGDVTVSMTVDAGGAVSRPQVSSTLGNPVVAACILKSVGKWKFPARPGGSAANASYKFALQ